MSQTNGAAVSARLNPVLGAHYNFATALAQKGDLDAAIEQYQEALRFKPDESDAREVTKAAIARGLQAADAGSSGDRRVVV